MKQIPVMQNWLLGLIALVLLSFPSQLLAGDVKLQAGVGLTTQIMPLAGLDVVTSYQTDGFDLWVLGFDKQEYSFTYHNLAGNGTLSSDGLSANVSVSLIAYEISYFALWEMGPFTLGPGIAYGIAEMTEDLSVAGGNELGDPSPFYTAKDIHYGSLMGKVSTNWDLITCDGIINSWGGLIGGSLVCGIQF